MAGRARDILLRLTGDPSDAQRALKDVRGDLDSFDRIQAEARADIEIAGAKAKLERLQNQLVRLSRQEATPAVQIKAASTVRAIEKIEADLKRLDGKKAQVSITETVTRKDGAGGGGGGGLGAGAAGGAAARLAGPVAAAGAIGGLVGKASVDAATGINESLSKNITLFGEAAKAVERFSETSAEKLGISKAAALEATGTFGNLLVALGLGPQKSADMSTSLVKLAADLASFNNASPEEALDAIRSGLTGETEPLRRFGVNINEAALKTQALSMGLVKVSVDQAKVKATLISASLAQDKYNEAVAKYGKDSDEAAKAQVALLRAESAHNKAASGKVGDLDAQTKALAAQGLIFKQTEKAQGDFAKTSEGLANKQRILKAEVSDLGAQLGEALVPAVTAVVGAFSDVIRALPEVGAVVRDVVGEIGGFLEDNRDDIDSTRKAFENVGEAVRFVFEEVVLPILRDSVEAIGGVMRGFVRQFRGAVRIITGILTGDFGKAWDGVKDVFQGGISAIRSVLHGSTKLMGRAGRAVGNAVKGGITAGFEGVKSIGTTVVNALIDVVNAGIRTVNKVLRPRDLGPLGTTPDLRIGEIGRIGDEKKKPAPPKYKVGVGDRTSGSGAVRLPAPSFGGLRNALTLTPDLATAGGTTVFNQTVNLPPPPSGDVPDARATANMIARELARRGRG